MAASTLTIHQVFHLRAPVAKVFRALTDPSEITKWFLAKAQLTPRRGGRYDFTWQGGYRHEAAVLEFVQNRRLTLEWPGVGRGITRVTFSVRREGMGTRLEVRHTGYRRTPAWLEMYGGTQSGWAYYLMNLKSVLEHGHDLRSAGDTA